jgi:hypothetical protein
MVAHRVVRARDDPFGRSRAVDQTNAEYVRHEWTARARDGTVAVAGSVQRKGAWKGNPSAQHSWVAPHSSATPLLALAPGGEGVSWAPPHG